MSQKDINIICAEMLIAKYFMDGMGEYPAREIIQWVKGCMKGSRIQRAEIKEARKNLGVQSNNDGTEHVWKWENEKSPEQIWIEKSEEFKQC